MTMADGEEATFQDSFSEELRENEALKDFTSIDGLGKAYIDTKAKIGGMITIPDGRATEETRSALWNKLGRPEKAEGYEFDKTAFKGFEYDDKSIDGFKTMAHSTGLSTDQAKGVFNWLMADTSSKVSGAVKDHQASLNSAEAKLKTEWGVDFEKNEGAMGKALGQFFNDEDQTLIATMIQHNPLLANGFVKIGNTMVENNSSGDIGDSGGSAPTRDEAIDKIKAHMNDDKGAYRNRDHPDHRSTVEEVRQLYVVAYDNVPGL